jgi:Tfp pilus assembly ATPase PilU
MDKLLELMAQKKASDMFISPGSAVHIKITGLTLPINQQKLAPLNGKSFSLKKSSIPVTACEGWAASG